MKIIIRADGGTNIGMGHIMRTLVLAENLKNFSEVIYACKNKSEFQNGIKYIREKGYKVVELDEDSDIKNINGDCLIVDSYDVDEEYFDKVNKCFSAIGYIDDLNEHRFNVDFIINQNVYAEDFVYNVAEHTKLFLGIKYLLLREEFLNIPKRNIRKNIKDIMITMGGSDNKNLTKKIALHINKAYPDVNLLLVIGSSFIYKEELAAIKSDKVRLYYNPKMSNIMLKCDLAISACGSTIYELCACGAPTIGIIVADNQKLAAEKLNKLGIIKNCDIASIANYISELDYNKRVCMVKIAQRLVDGLGAERLAGEIKNIVTSKSNNKQ